MEREALNFKIQGTAAAMTKYAAALVYSWIIKNDLWGKVLMPNAVHDELLCECPEEMKEKVTQVLSESMINAGKKFCKTIPMDVDCQAGMFWDH